MNNTENKKIFIIIPAYNEEKNIAQTLGDLINIGYKNIILIDDCSSDKTLEIARKYPIIILKNIINRGQGACLRVGNEYALKKGAEIIVHFDADGQFLSKEISDLIYPIVNENFDIIFGSRFMDKKSKIPWFKEKVIHPIGRIVNKVFFGIKMKDPQSGFRVLSRKAAKKINIEQDRMAHCSEILHKAFQNKLKIKEVPMTVIYNEFGQGFTGGISIVKDLLIKKILK